MSGISAYSGDTSSLSLVDLLSEAKGESSILDTSPQAKAAEMLLAGNQSTNRRAKNAYGVSASSGVGQAALNKALSELGANGGRVTFSDIAHYQKQLEQKFSVDIRLDLAEAGVSLDTEFTLNMNAEGQIQVICDDPVAKGKIQKYLSENPDVCEQFGYIQALANLERAKQGATAANLALGGAHSAKVEIQLQAVETFFSDALSSGMSYSPLLASFGSISEAAGAAEATSYYAGIDFTV